MNTALTIALVAILMSPSQDGRLLRTIGESDVVKRETERIADIQRDPLAPPDAGPSLPERSQRVQPPALTDPSWLRHPRATYPEAALMRGLSGSVDVRCTVNPDGSLTACTVVNETPTGYGFGRAVIAATRWARLSQRSVDSAVADDDGIVNFQYRFNLPM